MSRLYTTSNSYMGPTADTSNVWLRARVSACRGMLLNPGIYPPCVHVFCCSVWVFPGRCCSTPELFEACLVINDYLMAKSLCENNSKLRLLCHAGSAKEIEVCFGKRRFKAAFFFVSFLLFFFRHIYVFHSQFSPFLSLLVA